MLCRAQYCRFSKLSVTFSNNILCNSACISNCAVGDDVLFWSVKVM